MELTKYLASLDSEERAAFCAAMQRHPNYIHALAVGAFANGKPRKPSPETARLIELHSNGAVRRWEVLPEVFDPPRGRKAPRRPTLTPEQRRVAKRNAATKSVRKKPKSNGSSRSTSPTQRRA